MAETGLWHRLAGPRKRNLFWRLRVSYCLYLNVFASSTIKHGGFAHLIAQIAERGPETGEMTPKMGAPVPPVLCGSGRVLGAVGRE